MWLHSANPSICRSALGALCNIGVDVAANRVSEITPDDLEAVVLVMRTHRAVRAVQEGAIGLLANSALSHANVRVLERSPFVVPLVRSAMSRLDDDFRRRAEILLRAIPVGQ